MPSYKRNDRASGVKHDQDKPRMDLLDPSALLELANVLTFGAKKYSSHNWRKGIHLSRLIGAAYRHLTAFNRGHNRDKESKLLHAAHLMCCAQFMIWTLDNRPDLDDRWKDKKCTYSAKKRKR